MRELRYGLIGAGMMGQEHVRNVALVEGAGVTAVADPDEEMRNRTCRLAGPECKPFADYRALLAEDPCDAYLIAAPNDLHYPILLHALATGKPILCEKPLCTRSQDAADVVRRAAGRGTPVWVAMEYRYMPPIERMLKAVRAGDAGAPRMMSIREHRYPFLDKVGDWNRFAARTGGTLVEKCCHFWDLMRLGLAADPVRVYASGAQDVNHLDERPGGRRPDVLDNAFAVVEFEGGLRGMLDLCMFAEGSRWQETVAVVGDAARLEARVPAPARFAAPGTRQEAEFSVASRATRVETSETVPVDPRILHAGDHHGATFFQHERFRDLVARGGGDPEVGLEDGYWAVLVGEAAEESARSGRAVELAELAAARVLQ